MASPAPASVTSSAARRGEVEASCIDNRMRCQSRTVEEILARLASSAHGVVTHRQLLAAGITARRSSSVRERRPAGSASRRLPRWSPGTQRRGALSGGRASVGQGVLSGRAAGYLLGIVKGKAPPPDVTAPTQRRVSGASRGARAPGWTGGTQRSARHPVTTVARTIVDLAAELSRDELARACHEAGVKHRVTPAQVEAVLARRPRAKRGDDVAERAARRGPGLAQRTRAALSRAAGRGRTGAPADEPGSRGVMRGLPLARAAPDGGARQLHLPPLTTRLGAGSPTRTGGLGEGRRVRPLDPRRRLRESRADDGR